MAEVSDSKPIVAVVMGSSSDWETMRHACEILERFLSLIHISEPTRLL